ncbi:Hpt domain-containing protein [Pelosinus sp. sgz500959]|uniref:Hpt domain-containing protein n=1 Tax=Pelosinus sp. sgz500959 TaxID=3242472 RepID=UPI00367093B6
MDEAELERHLAEIFFIESGEMLSEASLALLKAEEVGNPQEVIQQVFRTIHSIKGGAQSLGFERLSEVAHHVEDFLVPLRNGDCNIDGQTVSLILESMDVIEMQLSNYQTKGESPVDCTLLLAKLAETVALTENRKTIIPSQSPTSNQEKTASINGSRLLYLSFIVDPSAAMPGMTAFLLLEQLRQEGKLLYSKPDIDQLGTVATGEYLRQVAIIQTNMCNADVKQIAYSVGDIRELKVAEIDNGIFSNSDKPAKEEITYFNSLVGKMQKMLFDKDKDAVYFRKIVKHIIDWGEDSRGVAGWFPGGLPRWKSMTSLLSDTVALMDEDLSNYEKKSVVDRILQILWGAVYNALCNHTYFYNVPVHDVLDGNGKNVIEELQSNAVDVQVVVIDLSLLTALEAEHLRKLADFRDLSARNGWVLWLISEGQYTRRHLNVLEVSEGLVGALEFYPSICSAVLVSKKFITLEEDGYVSEI